MNDLHAIFRAKPDGSSWEAYSRPISIHAGGPSLDLARDEFNRAAEFHFEDEWPEVKVITHIEKQVILGVYARTVLDRHTKERELAVYVLGQALRVPQQYDDMRRRVTTVASTGDVVFVCCLPSDPLSFVTDQLGRSEALQVCATFGDIGIWWTTLASPLSSYHGPDTETLADAGLSPDEATISDLMQSDAGHRPSVETEAMTGGRTLVVTG